MAESINQQIADALTERQLRAGRVEMTLRRQVWEQLALLEAEIISALKSADPTEFALLSRRRREVEQLMDEAVDPLIVSRYLRLATMMDTAMGRIAVGEAQAVQRIVNDVTEDETIEETPPDAPLKRRVAGALFPTPSRPTDLSATGAEWWTRQGESLSMRVRDTLRVSVSLEESLTQMTQRVRGTSEAAFQDGIMGKARSDASRLLTTQVTNAVGEARTAVAERNAGPLRALRHTSVLDSRTSLICLGREGLLYNAETHEPIGHSIPYLSGIPYHPQ